MTDENLLVFTTSSQQTFVSFLGFLEWRKPQAAWALPGPAPESAPSLSPLGLQALLHVRILSCLSRVWLCVTTDCGPLGSSAHGILQARILEWVAIPFSRESSWPRKRTQVSCIAGRFFTIWATREAPRPPSQVSFKLALSHLDASSSRPQKRRGTGDTPSLLFLLLLTY